MSFAIILLSVALDSVVFGPGGRFQREQSKDSFGTRSHGILEQLGPSQTKFYPMPQSTAGEYIRLRPEDLRIKLFTPEQYEREEVIGHTKLKTTESGLATAIMMAKA